MLLVSRHDQAFSILAKTDQTNRRLWVQEYQFRSPSLLRKYLKDFAREQGLEKIIMPVKEEDLGHLRSDDFVVEGFIEGYFPSSKGYFLSAYPYRNRGISDSLSEEQKMLQNILSQPQL
ncbi:MAG: putative beta-lysine N-acetyltransferase, partial [Firmicutes bacterium]|nr:putative beta-lysine N-acetyltransferase [Bacillota bacterium]